ncbi:MAG: hypothetical protein F4X54_07580 [Chloroflexi bacterium]|nr:hypothetical protein [Chloroflexota bacterium]
MSSKLMPSGKGLYVSGSRLYGGGSKRGGKPVFEDPSQKFIDGDCMVLYTERGGGKSQSMGHLGKRQSALYRLLETGQDVIGNLVIGESHICGERIDCFPELMALRLPQEPGESDAAFAKRQRTALEEAVAHEHGPDCPTVPIASDDTHIIPMIRKGLFRPHRSLILIDEFTKLSNSWNAMSRATKELVDFLTQIRKYQCELIATTQFPRRLSGAVGEQIQWWGLVIPYPEDRKRGDLPDYVKIEWYKYQRGGPALPEKSGVREPDGGTIELTFPYADMIDTHAEVGDGGVRIGPQAAAYQLMEAA